MADVYEKNLDSKTSLTVNDYIRVVGSDNVSYKQLVSDVADKIITTYTGASLAGSNQSVKSAIDASQPKTMSQTIAGQTTVEGCLSSLNSKTAFRKTLTSSDNLNDIKGSGSSGLYYISGNVQNSPRNWGWMIVIEGSGTGQFAFYENQIYVRAYTGTPLQWSSWKMVSLT